MPRPPIRRFTLPAVAAASAPHDRLAIAFGPGGRTVYVLCSPTWIKGSELEFGIGSVFPVTVATGKVGKPVLTGRGSLSLAVLPGRSYEPWEAGLLK